MAILTPGQFQGWADYYSLEPFGYEIEESRHARLCTLIARINGVSEAEPADFTRQRTPIATAESDPLVIELKKALRSR